MSNYVELSELTKVYPTPKGEAVIVKNFNLNIQKGEFVTLIGHSGCGKSTVLSMLAGLNDISDGGIILAGRELSGAGPDRGVVFQSPSLLPWMTAYENVMLGVEQVFFTASKLERQEIVEYYLTVVSLGDAMHKSRRNCPKACGSALASRVHSHSNRKCCCSMSRSECLIHLHVMSFSKFSSNSGAKIKSPR